MTNLQIFIVEDEAIVAHDLAETIKSLGYGVAGTARSGEIAIEKISKDLPDLVLMDIHLAGKLDGIQTAEEIHKATEIPVIYLTAYADKGLIERAKVTGPYGYLVKPYDERELHSVIEMSYYKYTLDKKLLESEKKYRSLTENTPDIVFTADMNGTITYASPKVNEYGFLIEEVVGGSFFSLVHSDDRERVQEEYHHQLAERARFNSTFRTRDKWGNIHYFEVRSNLVLDESGNVAGIDGLLRDITDRIKAEDAIKRSLKEKEVLLKEIHHRVKNNLQVVWGLIDLQVASLDDPDIINILHDSQNRIRTMSLIHETLYRSDDISRIRISRYLESLMNTLFSTYSISRSRIEVRLDIEDVQLDVESAIPCGLIVNELVSNAFKHAFPGERTGEIRIGFHLNDKVYTLTFADNGVGIPPEVDYLNTNSLGLKLVTLLSTDQLDGTIQLTREGGTCFTITFPQRESV